MPVPFPRHYQTLLVRTLSSRARLEAPPRPIVAGSTELEGESSSSPEHMMLNALGLCLLQTFEALAARDRIDLVAWDARVKGMVDKTETGLQLTKYQVEIDLEVGDIEKARATLDEAHRHCLIVNALRAPVEIDANIRTPARKAG